MNTIDDHSKKYKSFLAFCQRRILPILLIAFGSWWLWRMIPAWISLEPMSIGKFTHTVITWQENPYQYAVSAGITFLGCITCIWLGFSQIFNIGEIWHAVLKRKD
ncbi:hypothetical protein P3G55_21590 [Leptospira sp. 96542]|nr:hypothetical protein [Leptospira sp. 96542]